MVASTTIIMPAAIDNTRPMQVTMNANNVPAPNSAIVSVCFECAGAAPVQTITVGPQSNPLCTFNSTPGSQKQWQSFTIPAQAGTTIYPVTATIAGARYAVNSAPGGYSALMSVYTDGVGNKAIVTVQDAALTSLPD